MNGGDDELKVIKEILDFWYQMDCLGQKKLPADKQGYEDGSCYFTVKSSKGLKSLSDSNCPKGKKWELGYAYVGRIPLDLAVGYLASLLSEDDDMRAQYESEKTAGDIAAILIRFDDRGKLHDCQEGEFSGQIRVSPVLWAIAQASKTESIPPIANLTIKKLEEKEEELFSCFNKEFEAKEGPPLKSICDWVNSIEEIECALKALAEFSKGKWRPESAFDSVMIELEFGKPLFPKRLTMPFYDKDISAISEAIKKSESRDALSRDKPWMEQVLRYINTNPPSDGGGRVDLLARQADQSQLEKDYSDILSASNTPLGRWPSKYSPALMQQCAVNLVAGDCLNTELMSVNGPPGTGKTTLLKDIIAANIVKKAIILSKLDDPDNAFKKQRYKQEENGYCAGAPVYYCIKEEYDKLNDLSILVCSSNNTAVENISKELPSWKALIEGVDSAFEGWMSTLLREDEDGLYFADAAAGQFGNGASSAQPEHEETAKRANERDMLLTARLGKRDNIDAFRDGALKKVLEGFPPPGQELEKAKKAYTEARKDFKEQLALVRELRDDLAGRQSERLKAEETLRDEGVAAETEQIIEGLEHDDRESGAKLDSLFRDEIKVYSDHGIWDRAPTKDELFDAWNRLIEERDSLKTRLLDAETRFREASAVLEEKESASTNASIKAETVPAWRLFKKRDARQVQYYERKLYDDARQQFSAAERERNEIFEACESRFEAFDGYAETIEEIRLERAQIDRDRGALRAELQQRRTQLENRRREEENAREILKKEKSSSGEGASKRYAFVCSNLIQDLTSDDEGSRKAAHLSNPASSPELDVERAKLFVLALRMTKRFVLASDCIRSNLMNLYAAWDGAVVQEANGVPQPVQWQKNCRWKDKERALPFLMQSLFILTPVVSSTFASIKRSSFSLWEGRQEEAPFGLLIIDEAGQAVPYAALGALARSRRSIIVGDPRQIPPVVTPELDILRNAWLTKLKDRKDYVSKSTSTQHLADRQNPYGSKSSDDEWVGCPLLVHRRCISPMFDISNEISYGKSMLNETAQPKLAEAGGFALPASCWINVAGEAKGKRDHFVEAQARRAMEIIDDAFSNAKKTGASMPSLFVISPFSTVIDGMQVQKRNYPHWEKFCKDNMGTVHKFQGKEADEVILLLGCDYRGRRATDFVKSNIVNVAASRAKRRFYVVGDIAVWSRNPSVRRMKEILDRSWYEDYKELLRIDGMRNRLQAGESISDEDRKRLESVAELEKRVLSLIPTDDALASFGIEGVEGADGQNDREQFARSYINNVADCLEGAEIDAGLARKLGFKNKGDLECFLNGFSSEDELEGSEFTGRDVGLFIKDGILKYDALRRFVSSGIAQDVDNPDHQEDLIARDCLSRFSFAVELMLKLYCVQRIRGINDDFLADRPRPTIGTIAEELRQQRCYLGHLTCIPNDGERNKPEYDEEWWGVFSKNVGSFGGEQRNVAMHIERKLGLADCDTAVRRLFHCDDDNYAEGFCFGEMPRRLDEARGNPDLLAGAERAQAEFNESKGERLTPNVVRRMSEDSLKSKQETLKEMLLDYGEKQTGDREKCERRIRALEFQISNEEKGANGERETVYELENSLMPIYILQDLRFKAEGLPHDAQIDILVVTPKETIVIECKNYAVDVTIDAEGVFRRKCRDKEIPFYSPLEQNNHHIDVMKGILEKNRKKQATPKSLVVFANREAEIEKSSEAKNGEQVIRIDQVRQAIGRIDGECKDWQRIDLEKKRRMEDRVAFWLEQHQGELGESEKDWLEKYGKGRPSAPSSDGVNSAATSSGVSDGCTYSGNNDQIPLGESRIVPRSDSTYSTITAVLEGVQLCVGGNDAPLKAQDVNKMLKEGGYIYEPEERRLHGKKCNWGITSKGESELGLVLLEYENYFCPGYPDGPMCLGKLREIIGLTSEQR